MLCGCIYEDPESCRPCDNVSVTLTVCSDRMETLTRTTDEDAVADVNLYLFGRNSFATQHVYSTSDILTFKCAPGEYEVFVLANMHEDLGEMTAMQLEEFNFEPRDFNVSLPMTGRTAIRISAGTSLFSLPPIEVTRAVAKVSCNISVQPEDMALLSAQLLCVPRISRPFDAAATPSDADVDYTDTEALQLCGRQASVKYYLLPNPQGTNPAIVDQQQKNRDNAPENATYLLIRATCGEKVLTYRVYLGENNTDNFDVRRNTIHTLNITIRGDNEVDTRVSGYTVDVWDTINSDNGYCIADPAHRLFVRVGGQNNDLQLSCRIVASAGDSRAFYVDGRQVGAAGAELTLADGRNEFAINYTPTRFDVANATLEYAVIVCDEYGFTRTFEFSHRFANQVLLYAPFKSVETKGAVYSQARSDHLYALVDGDGCTITATAHPDYIFRGWYSDAAYRVLVSTATNYHYKPQSRVSSFYAKYEATGMALDQKATANCYVAPDLNRWYSFDARVMGNGKSTLNITPRPLAGTTAKVLWESSVTRGDVIRSVSLSNGRIVFETGTQHGNALIGLFDAAGECVWSWHIWAADYNPNAACHTYASGAVFMDRNLGALTTDCSRPEARGLYYQWGRKDPFVRSDTSPDGLGAGSSLSGYEISFLNPAIYEHDYIMTIDWATKHPTTYIDGASFSDWDDRKDVLDWLYTSHPNLWGNRTTGNASISMINEKTIYDPCPPGWRVPHLEAFKDIEWKSYGDYTSIYYRGTFSTDYPLTGFYFNRQYHHPGVGFIHTNAPYARSNYGGVGFREWEYSFLSFDKEVHNSSYFRFAAMPVRCIKE